jgi:hypothetical protein
LTIFIVYFESFSLIFEKNPFFFSFPDSGVLEFLLLTLSIMEVLLLVGVEGELVAAGAAFFGVPDVAGAVLVLTPSVTAGCEAAPVREVAAVLDMGETSRESWTAVVAGAVAGAFRPLLSPRLMGAS